MTKKEIKALRWKQQSGLCWLCGQRMEKSGVSATGATLDHVVPKGMGGTDDARNLRLAHRSCNTRRGDARRPRP